MIHRVTIIDYGMGNLFSVGRAFEHAGVSVIVASSPEQIAQAESVVLPGVGSFADGMAGLEQRGLVESILAFCQTGRPFLGICLGMQMMLEWSEEFGVHRGLGLIPGRVKAIPSVGDGGVPHKIPHIGWNELVMPEGSQGWQDTILSDISPGTAAYFVHSYAAVPEQSKHRLADCYYDGCSISAVVRSGPHYGCQFHPEKSGEKGIAILKNFLKG